MWGLACNRDNGKAGVDLGGDLLCERNSGRTPPLWCEMEGGYALLLQHCATLAASTKRMRARAGGGGGGGGAGGGGERHGGTGGDHLPNTSAASRERFQM